MAVRKEMKSKRALLLILMGAALALALPSRQAQAACAGCCDCVTIRNLIVSEMDRHEDWLIDTFWGEKLEPALSVMTNKINNALIAQSTKLGSFTDALSNSEKALTLQELSAQTANDYAPSETLCRYGTLGLSLAASEEKAKANRLIMIERSLSRQLGRANTAGAASGNRDAQGRANQVLTRFCDKSDNGNKNREVCKSTNDRFLNADMDFVRTFESKPTLDIDFTEVKSAPTDDEINITALSDNIFANDLFSRPKEGNVTADGALTDSRLAVMDLRSLVAKRSVAEHSFNTLVAMKSRGSGMDSSGGPLGSTSFIKAVLTELGLESKSAEFYLGKAPSYDAQMEVLTKKIFQSPSFYVNLMENPANVERQYAALQSFGLMQQRDIFDSILRSEMLLSLIVELEVAKYQDDAQSMMDR